jgi:hypothetical protein
LHANRDLRCDNKLRALQFDIKGSFYAIAIVSDDLLGLFERICYEIVGLEVINHVIKMILCDFLCIKRVIFGHIRHALIKFSESAQDTSAIDLQL